MAEHAEQQVPTITTVQQLREASQQPANQTTAMPQTTGDTHIDPLGPAFLGQTALALMAIIALILISAFLVKRIGPYKRLAGGRALRLVAGQSIGPRERVVVMEIEETWLVLGVTQNNINLLHKLPARHDSGQSAAGGARHDGERPGFKQAFAENLRQATSRWSRH